MTHQFRIAWIIACSASWLSVGLASEPALRCAGSDDFTRAFSPLGEGWAADGGGLRGESPERSSIRAVRPDDHVEDGWTYFNVRATNLWRYALTGDPAWSNCTVECTVRVVKPSPIDETHRPGEVFFNYQWGREAVGSDAALLLRWQSPDENYMVRFSSGYGHVELWKTHGGVVCVRPCNLKPGIDHRVRATAAGPWVTVAVDGAEVLRYADPVDPIPAGRVGVAVRESQVLFTDFQVSPAPAEPKGVPPHKPDFHLRKWVGRDYIFDGDEPIGWLRHSTNDECAIHEVKLVPGVMPMAIVNAGATWGCLQGRNATDSVKVQREGKTFRFSVAMHDKQDHSFDHAADWEIRYEPSRGYVWDKRVRLSVLVDDKIWKWGFNQDDALFYQAIAPATTKLPQCRTGENYAVFTRPDGRWGAFPANHDLKNGGATWDKLVVKKGGCWAMRIDQWAVVNEFPEDNPYQYYGDYCFWGLDLHMSPTQACPNAKLPMAKKGDVFEGHSRWYAWNPQETSQRIREGVPPQPQFDPAKVMDVAHVEPVNRFSDLLTGITGDSKVRWQGALEIDRSTGHGDSVCIRINGEAMKDRSMYGNLPSVRIGPSYRTGPYLADRYRIGAWVKADDFTGKFTILCNDFVFQKPRQVSNDRAELAINGKCDWTYVSFVAEFPRYAHSWWMRLDPAGKGTVWVDDVEVVPLE